jgi:lipoate-protein ligase B
MQVTSLHQLGRTLGMQQVSWQLQKELCQQLNILHINAQRAAS